MNVPPPMAGRSAFRTHGFSCTFVKSSACIVRAASRIDACCLACSVASASPSVGLWMKILGFLWISWFSSRGKALYALCSMLSEELESDMVDVVLGCQIYDVQWRVWQ